MRSMMCHLMSSKMKYLESLESLVVASQLSYAR